MRAQCGHVEAERREHMIPSRLDAAAEERVVHVQTRREREHDVIIGAAFATWAHHALTQLHEFHRALVDLEADAQALAFPRRIDRQKMSA